MPQTTNNTTYAYNGQANGTTPGGTQWSVTLVMQAAVAPGSTDFTDADSFTLLDDVTTLFSGIGWTIPAGYISVSKTDFNDTLYNGDETNKTYV
jgi:hypothetical protein